MLWEHDITGLDTTELRQCQQGTADDMGKLTSLTTKYHIAPMNLTLEIPTTLQSTTAMYIIAF